MGSFVQGARARGANKRQRSQLTGCWHQVHHRESHEAELFNGMSVTVQLRTSLFPHCRARLKDTTPSPRKMFFFLAEHFRQFWAMGRLRLPTLTECEAALPRAVPTPPSAASAASVARKAAAATPALARPASAAPASAGHAASVVPPEASAPLASADSASAVLPGSAAPTAARTSRAGVYSAPGATGPARRGLPHGRMKRLRRQSGAAASVAAAPAARPAAALSAAGELAPSERAGPPRKRKRAKAAGDSTAP